MGHYKEDRFKFKAWMTNKNMQGRIYKKADCNYFVYNEFFIAMEIK